MGEMNGFISDFRCLDIVDMFWHSRYSLTYLYHNSCATDTTDTIIDVLCKVSGGIWIANFDRCGYGVLPRMYCGYVATTHLRCFRATWELWECPESRLIQTAESQGPGPGPLKSLEVSLKMSIYHSVGWFSIIWYDVPWVISLLKNRYHLYNPIC